MKLFIYLDDKNELCIGCPTSEALLDLTIEEIARKDIPIGKPFKIIDSNDLPKDSSYRAAWTIAPALLTDGIGEKQITGENE